MCFYHYNYDNARIAVLVVVSLALLTSLAYLILGTVLLGQISTYMTSSNILSYLPFVLICVLSICYFFVAQLKVSTKVSNYNSMATDVSVQFASKKYQLMLELKMLLYKGLITQEEFDREKENILHS